MSAGAWLVTGGAGYIGSHVVRALQADGQRVVVVDDLSTGIAERVPHRAQLEVFSVLETRELAQVMHDLHVTGVVHLAAKKAAGESVNEPVEYHNENTGGVISLLTAMAAAEVRRLVYSSSAAVYGEPVDDNPLTEASPTNPTNPYGSSKLIGEMMIRDSAPALGLSWAGLRYFNVAGAGAPDLSDTSANNLIPMLLRARAAGRPAKIFGSDYPTPDGTCIRDYIHVSDLADAHVAACRLVTDEAPGSGVILNIGTGRGSSVREVIESMSLALGDQLVAEEAPRRDGDPSVVQADPSRAAEALGWRSSLGLDDMTASAVAGMGWLESHGYL
ncbi:MAG: UDP-glucose 4-epimerase [Actinomycetota bacterium]|nr:UDP-glucose 4-epimerase [Actinomycetota bacterium]